MSQTKYQVKKFVLIFNLSNLLCLHIYKSFFINTHTNKHILTLLDQQSLDEKQESEGKRDEVKLEDGEEEEDGGEEVDGEEEEEEKKASFPIFSLPFIITNESSLLEISDVGLNLSIPMNIEREATPMSTRPSSSSIISSPKTKPPSTRRRIRKLHSNI